MFGIIQLLIIRTMKNKLSLYILLIFTMVFASCESLVEGINENPNDVVLNDIEDKLFLTGSLLANAQVQSGRLNNIAGMYSGQLIGFASLFANQYNYNLTTANSDGTWRAAYVGVVTNMRYIGTNSENVLLQGIAKVTEAHAVGTCATIFGAVPYSEIGNAEISDPKFDSQIAVFNAMIALLDDAVATLNSATSQNLSEDIYFGGDKGKWIAAAYTLKARYYLQMKDYTNAMTAAENGIASADGDMKFIPRGAETNTDGDKNLFWAMLESSRAGDVGNLGTDGTQSYLLQMLDATSTVSRNHAKTDETARLGYYEIAEAWNDNDGIIDKFAPQNMVTYFENQLIKAECAARNGTLQNGLTPLNELRSWLSTGGHLNDNYVGQAFLYDAFDVADFDNGGIENADGVDAKTAFLREVIEERYVSGFGMYMPFNDARRLRKSDSNIAVPFILVNGSNPPYPERMPYAEQELNSNSNAPTDPGIFGVTAVNQ
jgi:hypothetical protein